MLQAVLFICNIASQQCALATASSHYTIACESQTPMGCIMQGYAELAKMDGVFDPKTQVAVVSLERR